MIQDLLFDRSYVNGKWTNEGNSTFDVLNPVNKEKIATILDGGTVITKKAIQAANKAFKPWAKSTAKYRSTILEKLNELLIQNTDVLAEIMTLESGKPINESKGEVTYVH